MGKRMDWVKKLAVGAADEFDLERDRRRREREAKLALEFQIPQAPQQIYQQQDRPGSVPWVSFEIKPPEEPEGQPDERAKPKLHGSSLNGIPRATSPIKTHASSPIDIRATSSVVEATTNENEKVAELYKYKPRVEGRTIVSVGPPPNTTMATATEVGFSSLTKPPSARRNIVKYVYNRLDFDTHEIRLLIFEEDSMRYKMQHVSLISPGSYTALSYCWGDAKPKKTIFLNGYKQEVTINLFHALQELRRLHVARSRQQPLRVWVDALCINQGDNRERSEQVRKMREIYSLAEDVIAYVASQNIRLDEQTFLQQFGAYGNNQSLQGLKSSERQTLNALFGQPYWKRVWIIQELTVADKVTILYGGVQLSWTELSGVLTLSTQTTSSLTATSSGMENILNAQHLSHFRQTYQLEPRPISLLEAMEWSTRTLATDPRDKIFALLGLCHDGFRFVPIPTYKQSLGAIIVEMSRAMMKLTKSLDLMVLKGIGVQEKAESDLPSWIPNWPKIWAGGMTCQESAFQDWRQTYPFNPLHDVERHDHAINSMGACLGEIAGLTTSMKFPCHDAASRPPLQSWIHLNLAGESPELTDPSHEDLVVRGMVWRSLVMDSADIESIGGSRAWNGCYCFPHLWTPSGRGAVGNLDLIDWIDRNVHFRVGRWTLREWSQMREREPETKPSSAQSIQGLDLFLLSMERILGSGMRLASVKSDNRPDSPCMVHPSSQVGDKIFVLKGCSVPVVLRRVGEEQWQVVGGVWAASNFHPWMQLLKYWKTAEDSGWQPCNHLQQVVLR